MLAYHIDEKKTYRTIAYTVKETSQGSLENTF